MKPIYFESHRKPLLAGLLLTSLSIAACGGGGSSPGNSAPGGSTGGDTGQPVASERDTLVAQAADPSPMGEFTTLEDIDYDFGRLAVSDPIGDRNYETDIHGYTVYSEDSPTPMPVILLLHGRHQTCETEVGQAPVLLADDDNCPEAVAVHPARSYRGYDYLARNLASHGYFVLSIDANDINDNDGSPNSGDAGANARAQLVQAHLDAFRDINSGMPAPDGDTLFTDLAGKLDMNKIGVMGHSRGGDGVARYVTYNRQQANPHNVIATFALAPTDYNQEFVDGQTFVSLLPYCDGDVEDVQGAFIYDDSRFNDPNDTTPKFQIVTMGSNHNYFNTVWTSDDWTITDSSGTDPFCGTNSGTDQRDSPAEQRALGLFFMASFFRYFVGDEIEFGDYWNGRAEVPDFACPGGIGPCEGRHHLSVHAPAADRIVINAFASADDLATNALGGAVTFNGFSSVESCDPERNGVGCPSASTFSITPQLAVSWNTDASITQSFSVRNAANFDVLSLRMAVSTLNVDKDSDLDFSISLSDGIETATLMASAFTDSLYNPPGNAENNSGSQKTLLNGIDFPVLEFAARNPTLNLAGITDITLNFTGNGAAQLADMMLMRTAAK